MLDRNRVQYAILTVMTKGAIRYMGDQEVQKSCWGVTTWAVAIFLGIFSVVSFFNHAETKPENHVSVESR